MKSSSKGKTLIQMQARSRPGPDNYGEFAVHRNSQRGARRDTIKMLGGIRKFKRAQRLNRMITDLGL